MTLLEHTYFSKSPKKTITEISPTSTDGIKIFTIFYNYFPNESSQEGLNSALRSFVQLRNRRPGLERYNLLIHCFLVG